MRCRRAVTRGFAVAAAAATFLAGGATAHASQSVPPAGATAAAPSTPAQDKLPDGLLDAMERDLGLGAEEAVERLAFQDDAADVDAALEERLGQDYAGAWVGQDENTLYVATTDPATEGVVEAEGATAVTVEHSLADLEAWTTALDGVLARHGGRVTTWHVDVTTNRVVVTVRPGAQRAAERLVARAGVPSGAVTFVESAEAPTTLFDVVGGNAFYIGGTGRCSVGFAVQGGFVTAGHCGTTGARTTSPSGAFAGSRFPGRDHAWVRTDAGNNLVGAVNNYSGGRVQVAGSSAAPVGASVCRSGSTTGWHCGTIQAYNSSVTYPQGTVTGLIRTTVCAEPGDSGGSLLAGNQAQGVTSGGSGSCRTGGTTYFQPVNEILDVYGLQLLTTDGGGEAPPPPADCSGHAQTFTGSLARGASVAVPNGSYFTVNRSGTHRGCLAGPSGSDFDLYLQKWDGRAWRSVAQGTSPGSTETITYSGTSGHYRYVVHAYAGSGSFRVGVTLP